VGTSKIMSAVELFWQKTPFTLSHTCKLPGSGISVCVARNGSSGAKLSALLPFTHCPPRSRLKAPLGVVIVQQRVSSNMVKSFIRACIECFLADNDRQFYFPVHLRAILRNHQGIIGPTSNVVDFKTITGSLGISILLSAAWSRKLRPIQTILLGRQIGGPRRTFGHKIRAFEPFAESQR